MDELNAKAIQYYRDMLVAHADDADGFCSLCNVACCQDWRSAHDKLAAAGEPMEPTRWHDLVTGGQ